MMHIQNIIVADSSSDVNLRNGITEPMYFSRECLRNEIEGNGVGSILAERHRVATSGLFGFAGLNTGHAEE